MIAKYLNTTHNIVRYYIDNWEGKGFNGYYLFSKFLTENELKDLFKVCQSYNGPLNTKVKVWAYDADTLKLIEGIYFSSMPKAADYFKIMYTTILRQDI